MTHAELVFVFRAMARDDAPNGDAARPRRRSAERPAARADAQFLSPGDESDALFATRLAAGDASVFDDIFRFHFLALAAYVRRFVDSPDLAEDLAQDALIQLWNMRSDVRPGVSLTPLLRTIARRAALKHSRHLRVAQQVHDQIERDLEPTTLADATVPVEHETVARAVRAALLELPPRIRMVAVMRWLDELGRQAIADELGVSVRTVDAQLYQAATRIRRALAPYRVGPRPRHAAHERDSD